MNEAEELEQQRSQKETLRQVEKARQSRLKRREKRSFSAQGAAMDRKGIAAQDRMYEVGRHWDPDQQDIGSLQPTVMRTYSSTTSKHSKQAV